MSARIEAHERRFGEPIVVAINNGCTAMNVVPATDLARALDVLRGLVEVVDGFGTSEEMIPVADAARVLLAEVDR